MQILTRLSWLPIKSYLGKQCTHYNTLQAERVWTQRPPQEKLRGKKGFLQYCFHGRITITESLFHSFIQEAAARGLQN